MTLGEREASDLERAQTMLGAQTAAGLADAADGTRIHLRVAGVSKKTLATHLTNAHLVQGQAPLVRWSMDELLDSHEDCHRRRR